MNILQVVPELNVGGVETGTVDLAKYFVKEGHRSIVVSNGGRMVNALEASGTIHIKLPVHKKSLWTAFKMVKALRKIIIEEKADIVHARSRVPGWIAYFACRGTKAAFVTTCHGYYENRLFSQVMGWGKLVIVPSEVIGRHMIDNYKVSRDSIRCVPRSVDLERFDLQRERPTGKSSCVITMIGRLTPIKGHVYFLQAMAKVVRTIPYAKIRIIGDAATNKEAYKRELIQLVRQLSLIEHVEFLGQRQDIAEQLYDSDVLVFPSTAQESFGRVILEAQAAGVPVVATRVGGVIDIIDDGINGILVEPKDPEAIAREVVRLIRDKELSARIVIEAKKKILEKFTLKHMATKTLEIYQEVLQSSNILVIKLSSIGDVILVTASLRALRENFPKSKIYCLVGKESRQVLHNCPYIDGIIIIDLNGKDSGWPRLFKFSQKLRRHKFDLLIDFQNNRKSHLLAFLSFARESYGFENKKWGFFLTNPLRKYRNDIPPVKHQFQILEQIGIRYDENRLLGFWPSSNDKKYIDDLLESEWLSENQKIVGINLAASARWETKNWPIEFVAKLCEMLTARNIRVVITGLDKDRDQASQLVSLTKAKPAIVVGKTNISQLAELISRCKVFITPDSAPLHIAAAMKTPVIAFFGPTSSQRHVPPAHKLVVLEKKLECQPCYNTSCRIKTQACLRDIKPEEVLKQVELIIGDQE